VVVAGVAKPVKGGPPSTKLLISRHNFSDGYSSSESRAGAKGIAVDDSCHQR